MIMIFDWLFVARNVTRSTGRKARTTTNVSPGQDGGLLAASLPRYDHHQPLSTPRVTSATTCTANTSNTENVMDPSLPRGDNPMRYAVGQCPPGAEVGNWASPLSDCP
jgi:hypothetical protein